MLPAELDQKAQSQLTERLSNLAGLDGQLVDELRDYALHHQEPAVQVAAIIGLERIGSKRAVLALTERVLTDGALHPTERAMEGLAELALNGGLLALTATFLCDSRSIYRKLTLLYEGAKRLHSYGAAESLETIYRHAGTKFELRALVLEMLTMLEGNPLADISKGAILSRLLLPIPVWAENVPLPDDARAERAVIYSELRLPGLVELLRAHQNSCG